MRNTQLSIIEEIMHLYDLTEPNNINRNQGDKWRERGKLLEATVVNNLGNLEDTNTHISANNVEEETPGACMVIARGS